MTRPADIPQDIWDVGVDVLNDWSKGPPTSETIARAILAERERCAKKADRYTTAKNVRRPRELTSEQVYEIKIFARLIAYEIRKGAA